MKTLDEPISTFIWDLKYRYRKGEKMMDNSIADTWQRVATAVAHAEKPQERRAYSKAFIDILSDFQFLPGGRILAGAGTQHKVTLFNCFVMGIIKDDLRSIFQSLKEAAITLQQGGGVGYDFSSLRPKGMVAKQSMNVASGPVSFMHIWDSMCRQMQSTGSRRGAMMATLRCDHPDIEYFIDAKKNAGVLSHFNLSVLVSDDFINAVEDNQPWPLVFPDFKKKRGGDVLLRHWPGYEGLVPCCIVREIDARSLWEKMLKNTYDMGEPGVVFIDTINRMDNLSYCEKIISTNPCGEIPLPEYGACNLGSLNLTQYIIAPFTDKAAIDWTKLENHASMASRFLDNVVDVSRYPLNKQRKQALATRRIGLGITGLADIFVMLDIRYGSFDSIQLTNRIMQTINHVAWQTSIELAKGKGSFPAFRSPEYLNGHFIQTLPQHIQRDVAQYGIRNSHHTAIAPTGTISLLANNISSSIEPIYAAQYRRSVRLSEDNMMQFTLTDYAYRLWKKENPNQELPKTWVEHHQLKPQEHLLIQATVQKHVDNAIAKTINLAKDFPFNELPDIYKKAYDLGLKGCTIYRPNPIRQGILSEQPPDHPDIKCCS